MAPKWSFVQANRLLIAPGRQAFDAHRRVGFYRRRFSRDFRNCIATAFGSRSNFTAFNGRSHASLLPVHWCARKPGNKCVPSSTAGIPVPAPTWRCRRSALKYWTNKAYPVGRGLQARWLQPAVAGAAPAHVVPLDQVGPGLQIRCRGHRPGGVRAVGRPTGRIAAFHSGAKALGRAVLQVSAALMRPVSRPAIFPNSLITLKVSGDTCTLGAASRLPPTLSRGDQLTDCTLGFACWCPPGLLCGSGWRPRCFRFAHGPPPDPSRHAALLQAPISFDANVTAMEFASTWLDRDYTAPPNAPADDGDAQPAGSRSGGRSP